VTLAAGTLILEAINSAVACQSEWLEPCSALKHLNQHVAASANCETAESGAYETVKGGASRNQKRHHRVAVFCAILDGDSHRSGRCNRPLRTVFVSVTQIRVTHVPGEFRNDANPATVMAETLLGLPAKLVHCRPRRSR
jgi:hypothetical protein